MACKMDKREKKKFYVFSILSMVENRKMAKNVKLKRCKEKIKVFSCFHFFELHHRGREGDSAEFS